MKINEDEVLPCAKCKRPPRCFEVSGLWYIQCTGKCERLEVGLTPKKVVDNWNMLNVRGEKYIPKKTRVEKPKKDELDGVGDNGESIYQLSPKTGLAVKEYKSCHHLANALGCSKNSIVSKFYRAITGKVVINGKTYFREPKNARNNTETTSKTTRRGRPKKIRD
jgi:hypothetical protein